MPSSKFLHAKLLSKSLSKICPQGMAIPSNPLSPDSIYSHLGRPE